MVNKVGYFEPVGAHGDFRRMGLTKALMLGAMQGMKAMGLTTAQVDHETDNEGSTRLYHSVGFRPKYTVIGYDLPPR